MHQTNSAMKNKGEIELVTFSPRAECNYEECVGQSK